MIVNLIVAAVVATMSGVPNLNPILPGHSAHIMPTPDGARALSRAGFVGPLVYHGPESPVMLRQNIYAIFKLPPTLQTGAPTSMSPAYIPLAEQFASDYAMHTIDTINSQYYQILGGVLSYIVPGTSPMGVTSLAGFTTDTTPYPASGCTDTATPGNCITDAQVQTIIQNAMSLNGWTAGTNKLFVLFTSKGEGSAFGSSAAYTTYCGYHSFIPPHTGEPKSTIYANIPYGNFSNCVDPAQTHPNADADAEFMLTVFNHEIGEAVTDPLLTAWYASGHAENGDLCSYNYGTNTWDGGLANQFWNGHYYEIQQMWDNHTGACAQVGP